MNLKSYLAVPLIILASSAMAQEEEIVTLDDVKVSGNKEGRTLKETPESVTQLPPSRINRGDQNNSLEVLNAQANVQVARNAETFSIRGINSAGVTGFQKDNLASVFVDDVFQTDLAMRAGAFEVWDMSALQLYRGPQSTSQGVNSLAGSILLDHVAPQQADEAAVKLGYGSYNRREVGAFANTTALNKKLAVRVSFNKDVNDGFITNKVTGNEKWGRQDKGHFVGDFKYFFDDKSTLRFNNKLLRTDNGGNYTDGANPRKLDVYEDKDYRAVTNSEQHSLQYVRPLSARLENKTTLAFTKGLQNNTSDADNGPTNRAGTRREYYNDQFISLENVLKYESSKIKNALGVHAHSYRSFANYDFALLVGNTPVAIEQDLDKTRQTYAIFDSLLYKLNANHSLNLGTRLELVKNYYGTRVTNKSGLTLPPPLSSAFGAYDGTNDNKVFLPKVGYIYQKNAHTYGLTYSQGYRIGGLDINRSQAKTVKYGPERTDNYEASWKFNTDRFKTQFNLFYTKWKDQQVEVRLSNTDTFNSQVQNASSSEVYGGEMEGTYFWKADSLRFGLGHVHTQFLGFTNNGRSYSGNEFPDAPQWTTQTAWGHNFTDAIMSNLTLRHVSNTFTNAENNRSAPEQLYVDLNLQYSAESFVWELNAKNLLDRQYVLNTSTVYGNNINRVNRPRELNTRVTWFW